MTSCPKVSVVIAVHGEASELASTVQSVLSQTERSLECIIVCDGPLSVAGYEALFSFAAIDSRLRVLQQVSSGLTCALIRGCAAAQGRWIARLDVGDEMLPTRLEEQLSILAANPDCVLATSDVDVCGPAWEYIRTDASPSPAARPERVDILPPSEGIAMHIPHHASVTFRRDAYESVGQYRREFYFGQDWDLWFRFASVGTFAYIPLSLTRVRLFPGGISSLNCHPQRKIAKLSLACYVARSNGDSELPYLSRAVAVRPGKTSSISRLIRRADGFYFIAESLRRNGDRRCRRYFAMAIRYGFWNPRIILRAAMSFALP